MAANNGLCDETETNYQKKVQTQRRVPKYIVEKVMANLNKEISSIQP